jgi:hypothetical protein
MNEDATIKILSIIETLEREQQKSYSVYFKATDEQMLSIVDSIERDKQTYYYIYNLIIQDARQN